MPALSDDLVTRCAATAASADHGRAALIATDRRPGRWVEVVVARFAVVRRVVVAVAVDDAADRAQVVAIVATDERHEVGAHGEIATDPAAATKLFSRWSAVVEPTR